jgi:hypothetical protein
MNILLWVLQVALAFFCISGGSYKITQFDKLAEMNASVRAIPQLFWTLVGSFEVLMGLGLVVPPLIKQQPILVAYSAGALAVESVLLGALFLYYGDRAPVPYVAFGAVMAAFIAYGRFVLKPF